MNYANRATEILELALIARFMRSRQVQSHAEITITLYNITGQH